jgi:hypothetical protein
VLAYEYRTERFLVMGPVEDSAYCVAVKVDVSKSGVLTSGSGGEKWDWKALENAAGARSEYRP